jgi:ABC-2 type transport system ATP-binding protein
MAGMVLAVDDVSKAYRKNFRQRIALRHVGLQVGARQIVGLLGPNGAGKTTLLKIITGITRPDSGRVRLFDEEDATAARRRLGFLPENPEFFRNVTPIELLSFSLRLSGLPLQLGKIDKLLHFVNLHAERNEHVRKFSKGMIQRLGIAQAIIHEPELLVLDEPMSGLDPLGRRMIADIIASYHGTGKTILFATHDLDDIEALCSEVVVLNGGQIVFRESIARLRSRCQVRIDAEGDGQQKTYRANNEKEMWEVLDEIRIRGLKPVRFQSGIPAFLEKYYEGQVQPDITHPVS